jgi:Uncharacterized protein family, UPF0114
MVRQLQFPASVLSLKATLHGPASRAANDPPVADPNFIFAGRWLPLPLCLGLILAQCVYVFHFWVELVHLIEAIFGSQQALDSLIKSIGYEFPPIKDATC